MAVEVLLTILRHKVWHILAEVRSEEEFKQAEPNLPSRSSRPQTVMLLHVFLAITKQPAFDHPLLKDHKIQMQPN